MNHRSRLGTVALAIAVAAAAMGVHAQDRSKYPDWSGQWLRGPGMGNGWDPTKPQGLGQGAPLTPEYRAIFEASLADKAKGGLGGDPTGLCLPHGMPRMMIGIYPIEFVVTPKITYVLTDYTTDRRIFTDNRAWPKELLPSYNGYSIGNWIDEDGDGRYDALEVETRGFKGPRTFEGSGMPLHRDNETVIRERIWLDKPNKDLLHNRVTVDDHALTRPWTIERIYRREANPVWDFVDCAENNPHVLVGKEYYMISADGYLMPTKRGQPAPDLRYFKQQSLTGK
ncbi:MAG TPA: hypothetical protein VH684_05300 [Xanthobacteraceae bacterium]